ncbi:aldehyde dehydrogenase family protein, partial [Thioclava dalianensis]
GQRCSALRCLYVQEDIAPQMIEMIKGAMDELGVGNPWDLSTDVGPVIDTEAQEGILDYLSVNRARILHQIDVPKTGTFVPPTLISLSGIENLNREIFGPVLHLATFKGDDLDAVIAAINAKGFGLTFGLHTRIDGRVQEVADAIHVGNAYINRNQIGAIVGSQPFGGEGLSGTGPKAGGPNYVPRFCADAKAERPERVQILPGPTGELNRLSLVPRDPVLCLGPDAEAQKQAVEALGGQARIDAHSKPEDLATMTGISGVLWWGDDETARACAKALAEREGAIVPLITGKPDIGHLYHERHLCIDTTAAGGNAALLAG